SNGLWAQEGFPFLDSFVQHVTECYGAAVENLDFIDDPDGSREVINDWVAENTMDRILDLLPRGVISEDTRLVLTNAVYFKASWSHPFEEASTYRDTFHLHEAPSIEVPMMHQTKFFRNVVHSDYTAIELPYEGDEAVMLIVMPRDIQEFQRNLELETIQYIRQNMAATNVFLSMPKFRFTHRIGLSEVLKDMGMETAFESDADFSGFTGRRDLYISAVVHKAFVKVDEAGTEAAAATAVVANITAMPAQPTEISINRPFMFFIIHSETESILFMGRVMDPSEG
ncbi:MAG: serpin family protein, partial [Candidatus Aegiribacteria sp.]|nr:serpin family protein [Candidatus Aegiribacteria sp.]MBD3295352.1 serpin family protein [Candidatus Fermentibacteria bacterium]